MKSVGQNAARDLLLLSLTAGSADAIGFLGLGRVFTSNMTGNFVLMGIDVGQGDFVAALRILYVLAIFVSGVCLGAWLGRDLPEKDWPNLGFRLVGLEKIVLLIFALGWFLLVDRPGDLGSHALLALLALAMGLQSAALYRLSVPGVATTAITGTITAFATGAMALLFLPPTQLEQREEARTRVRFQFSVVLIYGCGAALGGWLILYLPHWAGVAPFLAAAFAAIGRPKP